MIEIETEISNKNKRKIETTEALQQNKKTRRRKDGKMKKWRGEKVREQNHESKWIASSPANRHAGHVEGGEAFLLVFSTPPAPSA